MYSEGELMFKKIKNQSPEEGLLAQLNLHIIFKEMVRGFVKAGHSLINRRLGTYPEGISCPEVKALWQAMTKAGMEEDEGQRELTYQIRDIVCVLGDCQDFYRLKFVRVAQMYQEELKHVDGKE